MSVTSAMFTGVSGLLNYGEAINVIGNNLANVNTTAFKSSRTLFADMLYANIGNDSQVGRGVKIQQVDTNYSQGSTQNTTNVTDLSIQGGSFFALGRPAGNANIDSQADAYLSRAGAFHVDKDLYLVNPEGYQVLDTNGDPILFNDDNTSPPTAGDFSKISKIDTDGSISYLDKLGNLYFYETAGNIGTATFAAGTNRVIAIVNPPNPGGLEKMGGNLYKPGADSGVPAAVFDDAAGSANIANGNTEKILSNSLELSNVDMATEFVNLITTQRAYSANSKTITTADEMTQEVLNLKR